MPTTPLRSFLEALACKRDRLVFRSDAELLREFASARDEAAFAELVRRHGRLVRGTARRIVGDADAAEDVFQAAFLLLARKAASIPWRTTVGPWLYQVACRLAAKARSRTARRPSPLPLVLDLPGPPTDPSAALEQAEIRAALDHALATLPAQLRNPLVLCYLEGRSHDEAAAALGCSAGTLKGRVGRGRERLRRILVRRGLSLPAALAGIISVESAGTAGAAAATARAAVAYLTTGAAAPAVRELLRETLVVGKAAAGLFGLVLACAATAVALNASPPQAAPPPVAAHPDSPKAARPLADAFGDPLPVGAVARLGADRLLGSWDAHWLGFSPDGTKLAMGAGYMLTVWDAGTGRRLVQRMNYQAMAAALGWRADGTGVAVVLLGDGSYFVSAFTDPDEELPKPAPVFPPPRNVCNPGPFGGQFLALSSEATHVAVVRNAEVGWFTIDLLPATPGRLVTELKPERTLGPFPGPCRDLQYTASGRLVFLSGSLEEKGDWSVSVINPDKNVVVRTSRIPAPGATFWRYMLSLSADARLAAVAPRKKPDANGHEDTIRVWDLEAGKELQSFPFAGNAYGTGYAFTPDGKRLIASTQEHFFQVWDVATGKETAAPSPALAGAFGRQREASAVAVSPDGKRFATARRDGRVDVWDTETGKAVVPLATHRDQVDAAAVSPDGLLAATLSYDESIRVWELATGKPVSVIPVPPTTKERGREWIKRRPMFTPDGRGLLFTAAGQLAMADPKTGKPLKLPDRMARRRGRIGGFTADGKTLATFADDVVTLWDWPAGAARLTITVPLAPNPTPAVKDPPKVVGVYSVSLSPDGRLLFTNSVRMAKDEATGGEQNANDVWDAHTGMHLHRLTAPETWYPPAAFSPDGQVMYLGGQSYNDPNGARKQADALTSWNPAAGTLRRRFADPSPQGAFKMPDGGRNVASVAASPDGRLLAAADGATPSSVGGMVWIYETASGEVLKKLTGHSGYINDLVFSTDGRRLVSVAQDQTGLVWDTTLSALGGAPDGKPTEAQLLGAWERLAGADPQSAYFGMAMLAADSADAVPLLRSKLRAAVVPTDMDMDRVVQQLDDDALDEREKASAELERFGPNAVAGAKVRLTHAASPEVRTRLTRFLDRYDGPNPSPYYLQCVRGVAVLEANRARELLAELAKGPAEDLLTLEARSAERRRPNR